MKNIKKCFSYVKLVEWEFYNYIKVYVIEIRSICLYFNILDKFRK